MIKLRWYINIVAICILVGVVQQTSAETHAGKGVNSNATYQQKILYYVNEYRVKHHLTPLKMSSTISTEAAKHSRDMASKTLSFGHSGYNGRIKRLYKKINLCRGGAENVAYYKLDAKKLVDAWIASPGHRQNIVGNYNLTGIGIAHSKKGWAYFTQIFLRSDSQNVA